MRRPLRVLPAVALAASLSTVIPHCAGHLVTTSQRILAGADSLFAAGNYLYARIEYAKVIADYPNTGWAEEAQYRIGYTGVFYDNPFADWESALSEFTKYQAKYPQGRWAPEVNSWLSLLHTLESYSLGYSEQTTEAQKSVARQTFDKRKFVGLADSLFRCEAERDSLVRTLHNVKGRMEALEELLLKLQ